MEAEAKALAYLWWWWGPPRCIGLEDEGNNFWLESAKPTMLPCLSTSGPQAPPWDDELEVELWETPKLEPVDFLTLRRQQQQHRRRKRRTKAKKIPPAAAPTITPMLDSWLSFLPPGNPTCNTQKYDNVSTLLILPSHTAYTLRQNHKNVEINILYHCTLFEIFIFCPKIQLWFPVKIVDFLGEKVVKMLWFWTF